MRNMKKIVKISIICAIVAVIAGCGLFFIFRKKEIKKDTTPQISSMIYSESRELFNKEIEKMGNNLNTDGTDNRVIIILDVNQNLDNIVWSLLSDFAKTETKVYDESVAQSFNSLKSSQSYLMAMMKEFNKKVEIDEKKSEQGFFKRHLGANDFFDQACSYLVSYAKFAQELNAEVDSNKAHNARFNVFDAYCNVVINSFKQTTITKNLLQLKDYSSINEFNKLFKLNGINLVAENKFGESVNLFNSYYSDCDKNQFAVDFAKNFKQVLSANQETEEEIAMFYFKSIYNVK